MISKISSSSEYGQIRFCAIDDDENSVTTNYWRFPNELMFMDSNDQDWNVFGSRGDGSWSNQIEIYANKYRVQMAGFDSGWVYDPIFSSSSEVKIVLFIK
jgi:hypothetical protein